MGELHQEGLNLCAKPSKPVPNLIPKQGAFESKKNKHHKSENLEIFIHNLRIMLFYFSHNQT